MWAERFTETVAASISGGVGVFVYVCVCVCVIETEANGARACMHVLLCV